MKAIIMRLVDLKPMNAKEAYQKGYKTDNNFESTEGYEVIYSNKFKYWFPKEIADREFFKLSESNDGSIILKEDVENFIASHTTQTIGEKTTLVQATTVTGFELLDYSACVSPKNYSQELGEKYAMENIINKLWSHLGFVLQWAKNGIKFNFENKNTVNIKDDNITLEELYRQKNKLEANISILRNYIFDNENDDNIKDSISILKKHYTNICEQYEKLKDKINSITNKK